MLPHGMMLWFVAKLFPGAGNTGTDAGGIVDVPRIDGPAPKVPMGEDETVGAGTAIRGLTPAFPISTDPNGIPVRESPPVDVEGADAIADAEPAAAQGAALPGNAVPGSVPPLIASPPPS